MRTFSDKDGLPANGIQALAFDAQGYLWIGTEVGLLRYDGRTFMPLDFPRRDPAAWITGIVGADDGSLWIGTRVNGLYRYAGGAFERFDRGSGLPSDHVTSICPTRKGSVVWVGTNAGLARRQGAGWETFTPDNSALASSAITAVLPSSSGDDSLWVGTRAGLARHLGDSWTAYRATEAGLPDDDVTSLLETPEQSGGPRLWVGTRGGGLASLHSGAWTRYDVTNSKLPGIHVFALESTQDASGAPSVWIGTYGGGLARLGRGTWSVYDTRNSPLANAYVTTIVASPASTGTAALWVGTAGGGIVRVRYGGWSAMTSIDGHPVGSVFSFLETGTSPPDAAFWMGTQEGIFRFAGGAWTHFDTENSALPNNFVTALAASRDPAHPGAVWVGTQSGLARYERKEFSLVASAGTGLPSRGIRCLLETVSDTGDPVLWVGTSLGLSRYAAGTWTTFDADNPGPGTLPIISLLETSSSRGKALWAATMGGGLARFEGGQWRIYDTTNSQLPSSEVLSLAEVQSPSGVRQLWAGGGSGGVAFFDLEHPDGRWTVLSETTDPALPNGVIYQTRQDRSGRVYLVTNRGVVRLTSPGATGDGSYRVESYTTEDGLPSNEGNARAGLVDREGRVWVGTVAGAAVFDPGAEPALPAHKSLVIESARVARTGSELVAGQALGWNDHTVSFEYALLSLLREREIRYRTELAGFDAAPSDWSPDGKSRYTNLPAGSYQFRVWAKDHAGNVFGPSTIAFRMRPAPWNTTYAYALYALAIISAGYGSVRLRTRALQRRTRMLETRVHERTAALREKNAELDQKNAALADNVAKVEAAHLEAAQRNVELGRVNRELLESNVRADRIFSALAEALPGKVLDRKYRLETRIGSGGFAVVFRATHLTLGRQVAVKVFRPTSGSDSARSLERFRREAVSSCRVEHRNAIQVHDSGISEDGIAYMVMELLEGESLLEALRRTPTMSLRLCAEIVVPVCEALAKAHEAGVIHRDIKPSNVFLHHDDQGETVKLLDFGIAKALGAEDPFDATLTNTNSLLGTPHYMAPERFRSRECDARADVYGVAVMLYRMLSGKLPFEGDVCELLLKKMTEEPRHLCEVAKHVPREIGDLIMRAMAKDVATRPTATELGAWLARLVDALPPEAKDAGHSQGWVPDDPDATTAQRTWSNGPSLDFEDLEKT